MTLGEGALLTVAAAAAGALNSIAGGGSFFSFPALLLTGVGPIEANATSAVALWPGSVAASAGYRKHLGGDRAVLLALGAASLLGGLLGAVLLVRTPPELFMRLLPFLLLAATSVFTFGEPLRQRLTGRFGQHTLLAPLALIQLVVATYGGYFGGGMGLMMLAAFSLLWNGDLHRMNALKSLLAVLINAVAIAAFVVAGKVAWAEAGIMILGATAGGYGGAFLALKFDPRRVRVLVVIFGWALTAYFFWRSLRS